MPHPAPPTQDCEDEVPEPDPDSERARLYALVRREVALAGGDEAVSHVATALCRVAMRVLGLSGAAVSVLTVTGPGTVDGGVSAASDPRARQLEELEFGCGEGPVTEAFLLARPVLVPDLESASGRWPAYAPAALDAGSVASFAFPLHLGAARLGVLHLHCSQARHLTDAEVATSLLLTELAVDLMLDAPAVLSDADLVTSLFRQPESRDAIYQAQGMVAVDLGLGLPDALARMRAHAYATGTDLGDLARALLAGESRLADSPGEPP